MSKKRPNSAAAVAADRFRPGAFFLPGLVLFLFTALTTINAIKIPALLALIVTALALLGCMQQLRQRLTWIMAAVALFVVVNGISTLYSVSGQFALQDFLPIACAFCVFVLILAFEPGQKGLIGRRAGGMFAVSTALASLLSIDQLSTRFLSSPFLWLMNKFSTDYVDVGGVETGVRMVSIYRNPNIFAGCIGLGVLLSLGLAVTEERKGARRGYLACLALNALAFVLSFSMGASGAIVAAFIIYLILELPQRRARLLLTMLETLVLTVIAAFPIYLTAFDGWNGLNPVPLVCAVLAAALLIVLDERLGRKLADVLSGHGKIFAVVVVALAALLAIYAFLSMTVTGGTTLNAGERLRRSAYPAAGTYSLAVQAGGDVSVTIESQNMQDTMMHTSSVLYEGSADGASFTVPEDSMVVYFNFSADQTTAIDSAQFQGEAGSGSVPLGYKLLPGFIANRMQGLRANQNAIQRLVFFQDGMKLFRQSPILGLGLGGFQNNVYSVQNFYYTTKYIHNHYIQALVDTGVVGFAAFVIMLLLPAAAVVRARVRREEEPLIAPLGAAMVFMAIHGGVEVVFSSSYFLPIALGVIAMISLCCGQPMALPCSPKAGKWAVRIAALPVLAYALLLGGNLFATRLIAQPTYANLSMAIAMDPFQRDDYMTSYVVNALTQEDVPDAVMTQAEKWAVKLEKVDSNSTPLYLAQAYFQQGETDKAYAMLEKYVDFVPTQETTWDDAFLLLFQYSDDSQESMDHILAFQQRMNDWNENHMGTITLSPQVQAALTVFTMD